MQLDVSFLPAFGAAFILMFARIGTMVMLLPGLGELKGAGLLDSNLPPGFFVAVKRGDINKNGVKMMDLP